MMKRFILFGITWMFSSLAVAQVGPTVFTPRLTVSPGPLTVTTGPTTVEDLTVNGTCVGCGVTSPGGSDTQVQYNNAGAFGGDAGLTYNATTDTLAVLTAVTVGGQNACVANSACATYARTSTTNIFSTGGSQQMINTAGSETLLIGGTGAANSTPILAFYNTSGARRGYVQSNSVGNVMRMDSETYDWDAATSNISRMMITSAGAITYPNNTGYTLPSGATLNGNGIASTAVTNTFSAAGAQTMRNSSASETLIIGGSGAGSSTPFISFYNSSGTRRGILQSNATGNVFRMDSEAYDWDAATNNVSRMNITTAGAVTFPNNTGFTLPSGTTFNGTNICLSDGTNCPAGSSTIESPTCNGFSSTTSCALRWTDLGAQVCATVSVAGTSNATTFTMTNINMPDPVYVPNNSSPMHVVDNGISAITLVSVDSAGTTVTFTYGATFLTNGFTAAGSKGSSGSFCFGITP